MNGGSGRHDSTQTHQAIGSAMRIAGRSYRIFVIEDVRQIQSVVQAAVDEAKLQNGVVVAVGGDGTINAVANVVLESGCLFGAIPQGTFNYFGRTHGIPEELEAALDDLLQGEQVPVQVGLVNEHVFLVNASVGLYPELLEDREVFKKKYGRSRLVAIWAALATVFSPHRHLQITLEQNGERVSMRTTTLFIGNNRLQLEQVGMPQAQAVQQGHLAAIAVRPVGKLAMLWLGVCGALGRLGDAEHVNGFSFRNMTVTPRGKFKTSFKKSQAKPAPAGKQHAGRKVKVAADGEIMWLQPPLEFRVAPQSLMLIKRVRVSEGDVPVGRAMSESEAVSDDSWKTIQQTDVA
jgi:diacylglycerol kinase family enzyme